MNSLYFSEMFVALEVIDNEDSIGHLISTVLVMFTNHGVLCILRTHSQACTRVHAHPVFSLVAADLSLYANESDAQDCMLTGCL